MFSFQSSKEPPPKCYITHGTVPFWIAPESLPSAHRRPFSSIRSKPFNSAVEILLDNTEWEQMGNEFLSQLQPTRWADIMMPLSAIVEEDFWDKYIIRGDIVMLSEGRVGVDDVYCLSNGVLILSVSQDSYERIGLQGSPTMFGNGKHLKNRWVIELNLRSTGMKKGKKPYDRMVWCFKNTIKNPVRWFLADGNDLTLEDVSALERYHPVFRLSKPEVSILRDALQPSFNLDLLKDENDFELHAQDLYEQFSLLSLQSPRVFSGDDIDPHLSRYEAIPSSNSKTIYRVSWRGMIPSTWVYNMFVESLRKISKEAWVWMHVHGFRDSPISWRDNEHGRIGAGENAFAFLRFPVFEDEVAYEPGGEDLKDHDHKRIHYLSWEIIDGFDSYS